MCFQTPFEGLDPPQEKCLTQAVDCGLNWMVTQIGSTEMYVAPFGASLQDHRMYKKRFGREALKQHFATPRMQSAPNNLCSLLRIPTVMFFPDICILLTVPSSGLWSCNQMQPRYTDTYHFISGPVQILTDVDGHPVIPYLPASSAYCTKYRECTAALDQAPFFTCSHVKKTEALY